MDPLSDILALLKPRAYRAGGFAAGEPWSVRFTRYDGIKCYAVVVGACWLAVEGTPEPVRLVAGECFILPTGRPFRLASDLRLPPIDAETIFPAKRQGAIAALGGDDILVFGGHFALDRRHADLLLGVLPPIVHLRAESDRAALRWSLERMRQEASAPQPGGDLVAQHLAHLILVQALRLYLAEGARGGVGWLFALADRQIGAAIAAIHAEPARPWTVQALADHVAMSRSAFAQRFKALVGVSPLAYLTRWRMLLAGERLTTSRDSIATIALSLGYESESAFSTAFKREMGCAPRHYGRGRAQPAPADPAPDLSAG